MWTYIETLFLDKYFQLDEIKRLNINEIFTNVFVKPESIKDSIKNLIRLVKIPLDNDWLMKLIYEYANF